LSVFSTCVLQSVCVHTMDFVSAINKQINKNKINWQLVSLLPTLLLFSSWGIWNSKRIKPIKTLSCDHKSDANYSAIPKKQRHYLQYPKNIQNTSNLFWSISHKTLSYVFTALYTGLVLCPVKRLFRQRKHIQTKPQTETACMSQCQYLHLFDFAEAGQSDDNGDHIEMRCERPNARRQMRVVDIFLGLYTLRGMKSQTAVVAFLQPLLGTHVEEIMTELLLKNTWKPRGLISSLHWQCCDVESNFKYDNDDKFQGRWKRRTSINRCRCSTAKSLFLVLLR